MNFVRSGFVDLTNSSLWHFGIAGYGWSTTGVTYSSAASAHAYLLTFNNSAVTPSNGPHSRRLGLPVRCLV